MTGGQADGPSPSTRPPHAAHRAETDPPNGLPPVCLSMYPPPLSSPRLVLPQGGGGGRHLLNPKCSVAAHCVVVAKPPPKSAAQSIPVESGAHVQEFKVKWSRTKKFYTEAVKE